MHSSVFVVKNDLDDGPYCSTCILAGLPADCEYATEIPLDDVKVEAIAEMFNRYGADGCEKWSSV